MLNENQISDLWERLLAAETRALFFADLANRLVYRKQVFTGVAFFLSSGAAATVFAKSPSFVPIVMSLIVAVITAYSFATGLDRKVSTAATLHSEWHRIADRYGRLWNHTYAEGADEEFDEICASEVEVSALAATEMPRPDPKLLEQWQDKVFQLHHLTPA
jgi:hypothetical protein